MSVNVYIQNEHVDGLIEFYNLKLKAIKQKKLELDKEEKSIRSTVAQLKLRKGTDEYVEHRTTDIKHSGEYSSKWTWIKKIDFAIKEVGHPLTTSEIVDTLALYEDAFEEGGSERRKAIASVSSTLSVKAGEETDESKYFIKIEEGFGRSKFFIKASSQGTIDEIEDTFTFQPTTSFTPVKDDDLPF